MHINKTKIISTAVSVLVSTLLVAGVVFAVTTISSDIITGALTANDGITVTRSLSSQTTENNSSVLSLTTDSSFLSGTNMTYSGGYGSSALKLTGVYSGTAGGYSNIYSAITSSGAIGTNGAGVVGVKSVVTNTAAMTDGEIYGGMFIAKHNHATNVMTASASLIGLEGWAYNSGAAPARTVIGGNFGYHNEGTVAKGAGSVYRGVQIFTDDASGSTGADERTSLALWNMAGTQTDGIKFIKSAGGWTNDITLQNGATISNATAGAIDLGGKLTNDVDIAGTNPGAGVKFMYGATGAIAADQHLTGIEVKAISTGIESAGGVTGGELNAKAKGAAGTATLNQLRGVYGVAYAAGTRKVTTVFGGEVGIQSDTGALITNATALQVSQQLASDGAGSSKIYGISIKADNVANTADIVLSGGATPANRPMIMSGAGIPVAGTCVATNLGSIYLRTDPASTTTGLYVCTSVSTWTSK